MDVLNYVIKRILQMIPNHLIRRLAGQLINIGRKKISDYFTWNLIHSDTSFLSFSFTL